MRVHGQPLELHVEGLDGVAQLVQLVDLRVALGEALDALAGAA